MGCGNALGEMGPHTRWLIPQGIECGGRIDSCMQRPIGQRLSLVRQKWKGQGDSRYPAKAEVSREWCWCRRRGS